MNKIRLETIKWRKDILKERREEIGMSNKSSFLNSEEMAPINININVIEEIRDYINFISKGE